MRGLSRAGWLPPTVVLVCVISILAAIPPARGAAGSVDILVLVPTGTFRVGDTVTVGIHIFNLGAAADPLNLSVVISGATAYRTLTYLRLGVGQFSSTFQIQAGDPAGLTYGGPTDIVVVQANATVDGLSYDGVGDVSVWPVAAALDMELSTPTGWVAAGTMVTANATVHSYGLLSDPDMILVTGSVGIPGSGYGPSTNLVMSRMSTGVYTGVYSVPASTPQDSVLLLTGEVELGADVAYAASRTVLIGRAHAFTIWNHVLASNAVSTRMTIFVANETGWPVVGANVSLYYPAGSCSGSGCTAPRWIYGTTDAFGGAAFTLNYTVQSLVFIPFWGRVTLGGRTQTFAGTILDPEMYGLYHSLCPTNGAVSYAPGTTVRRTYHTSCAFQARNQTLYYYASTPHAVVANGSVQSDLHGDFTLAFVAPSEDVLVEFRTNLTGMGWVRYFDSVLVADPGLLQISNLSVGQVAQITVDMVNVSGSVSLVPYNASEFPDPTLSAWVPLTWSPTYDVVPAVPGSAFHADLVLPRFLPKNQDYLLEVAVNRSVLNPGYVYAEVVHLANVPPTASASLSTQNPTTGQTVSANASASHDADGLIILYRVDWGDGYAEDWAETPEATHVYATPGTYTATVYVQDDSGSESLVTFTVIVEGTVLGLRASIVYIAVSVTALAAAMAVVVILYRRRLRPKPGDASGHDVILLEEPGAKPPGRG